MNDGDHQDERRRSVAQAIDRIREISKRAPFAVADLRAIAAILDTLAARKHLFDPQAFPAPPPHGSTGRRYPLHVDPDGGLDFSVSVLSGPIDTPPHDHNTWAAVASVRGESTNRLYGPASAGLALADVVIVRPGQGLLTMPADIHSVHVAAGEITTNLLLYGQSLRLTHPRAYDPLTAATSPYLGG